MEKVSAVVKARASVESSFVERAGELPEWTGLEPGATSSATVPKIARRLPRPRTARSIIRNYECPECLSCSDEDFIARYRNKRLEVDVLGHLRDALEGAEQTTKLPTFLRENLRQIVVKQTVVARVAVLNYEMSELAMWLTVMAPYTPSGAPEPKYVENLDRAIDYLTHYVEVIRSVPEGFSIVGPSDPARDLEKLRQMADEIAAVAEGAEARAELDELISEVDGLLGGAQQQTPPEDAQGAAPVRWTLLQPNGLMRGDWDSRLEARARGAPDEIPVLRSDVSHICARCRWARRDHDKLPPFATLGCPGFKPTCTHPKEYRDVDESSTWCHACESFVGASP